MAVMVASILVIDGRVREAALNSGPNIGGMVMPQLYAMAN
jgi:hypothetical protein